MSDNIKVVVKVRPLILREIESKLSYRWRVKNNTLYQLDQNGKDFGQYYTFDRVYDQDTKTSDVYDEIAKPIVQAATAGFNGTIFAYGQTSSGKTFTMTGTDDSPGIIPLAVVNLFEIIRSVPDRDFLVRVSYIEIYNETVRDLLNIEKENIKIHDTIEGIIKVDVTEKVTSTPEEIMEVMREGEANRQKGATKMNEESSRSHSIFQIIIESRKHIEGEEEPGCVNVSQLNLVDLAGSERSGQTGATGQRLKEGMHINKSLSSLALVIKQLSEGTKFTNFRDSRLTRILQNSLGGNAKTSIICAVTPAAVEETLSTLQFANRAKAIKNNPEVNAVVTADNTMIQRLTKQMYKLQAQLESKKNLEEDNHKLQSKITNLQKLILNGFANRRSTDMMSGSRRKLQQPRRITISTYSIPDDEPVSNIPKFCTPSLKYNPSLIPKPSEFLPLQNDKLAPVPEEPARLITPPPSKSVFFSDEVIELDSDDDSTRGDVQTCSPIHKCYAATKTPPCILRRNAKEAEKNLKGIIELTEREKLFSPNVVEYIEKLEHNATVIAKLRDQIDILSKQSVAKDSEMDNLKSQIKKTEEDIKMLTSAKNDLSSQCEYYNTRLTDAEVSYETLRNKAKLREEELLSLLEEMTAKNKKPDDIGKVLSRTLDKEMHFMDISKDISLVNSDSDSIINANDDEQDQMNELVTDTHTQLNTKNKNIIELEANIFAYQQKISALENLNKNLHDEIQVFKEKLTHMDNENSVLRATIDTLNSTIKGKEENLQTANNDIESYNALIQELQIKVSQKELKETLPTVEINDSMLETMIANEEQFITNNDNMRRIIHSLKIALETRNKEIDKLRSTIETNGDVAINNLSLTKDIESKTKEIEALNKQINENITSIHKLRQENNILKVVEHEHSEKITVFEHKTNELERVNRETAITMQRLQEENYKLTQSIANNNVTEKELSERNNQLLKQIEDMKNQIAELESDISEKDRMISFLKNEDETSRDNLLSAKAAVIKLQGILGTLSGNFEEMPDIIGNFINVFSVLTKSMNTLETLANDVVKEKTEAINHNADLKVALKALTSKYDSEVSALQEQIQDLKQKDNNESQEKIKLSEKISELYYELEKTQKELLHKMAETESLKINLSQNEETLKACKKQIADLNAEKEKLDHALAERETVTDDLIAQLEKQESLLQDKISEMIVIEEQIKNSRQERDELMRSVFKRISEFAISFNIQNDFCGDVDNDCKVIYHRILATLDNIGNHITFIKMKNVDVENKQINELLLEAKKEIVELTQNKLDLIEQLTKAQREHDEMCLELKSIQDNNKQLNKDLSISKNILQSLQSELESKSEELTTMETKVKMWKEQFESLDSIMKQQMDELIVENDNLKDRLTGNGRKSQSNSVVTYEHKDSYGIDGKKIVHSDVSSPLSLRTLCFNAIVPSLVVETESKTSATVSDITNQTYTVSNPCKCKQLTSELEAVKEENTKALDLLEELETVNKHLIQEQEAVRREVELLVAPAQELQKQIHNHKTNIAILTATTYAENRSLESQVKALQHHHSRFHNVCQRDIPELSRQLRKLLTLLKGDPSIADQQNASFKRYSLPDVLDSSTALSNFKNESTLDGDLLMLDTNITMTTVDNTLAGHDQTCLDLNQFYKEVSPQPNETNKTMEQSLHAVHDDQVIMESYSMLQEENERLRELIKKYNASKESMSDAQTSPSKSIINDDVSVLYMCEHCKKSNDLQPSQESLSDELKSLANELSDVKNQKIEIEQKYNNLILEIPSTDVLIKKLNALEKDFNMKSIEFNKLSKSLSMKTEQLKNLQEEHDSLSTQVMETISEAENLEKELQSTKKVNLELLEKCSMLEQSLKELRSNQSSVSSTCSECLTKDDLIKAMEMQIANTHAKLNRSLSDSDTSSRYNKICTLQSELHAGREDCKEISEDVATIKNHLDRSNIAMDFDDSMGDSNAYLLSSKDFLMSSPQSTKCSMPDIPEERLSDIYVMEKMDCLNYYAEKTGISKDNVNENIKIIDLMKTFYEHLITKHTNEVENLTNKLKDYDETTGQLEIKIANLKEKHSQLLTEFEHKDQNYNTFVTALARIKTNIEFIHQEVIGVTDVDTTKLVTMYKDFFKVLDNELGLSSTKMMGSLIDNIVDKQQGELNEMTERYTLLQVKMESLTEELSSVNAHFNQAKDQLSAQLLEYNSLKAKYERIQEISNAVTLDLIAREKDLNKTISNCYEKLSELNIVNATDFNWQAPPSENINVIFDYVINQYKNVVNSGNENENLTLELNKLKQVLEEKEKELEVVKTRNQCMQEINTGVTMDLVEKEKQLQALTTLHGENEVHVDDISKMSEEIKQLKHTIAMKEQIIEKLEMEIDIERENGSKETIQLIESVKGLQNDLNHLKSLNEVIGKEKDSYAMELLKSGETLKQNNIEMEKMTSDILVLRESVRENGIIIENMNLEVKKLLKENMDLKAQLEEKCRECFRLETNIKTHEKTAEIQTRMIMRLEKQKNEDDVTISEKKTQAEEMRQKYAALQKQCETLRDEVNDEIEHLKKNKETLEARVMELEALLEVKSRPSLDALTDSSRRRRQSLHDSKRLFDENKHEFGDHNVETIFESRAKPDDLFPDIDDEMSNRSSPIVMRNSKGRDSSSFTRTDQEEEPGSRPSSVVATRRRRQSTHDLHRTVLRHTPSPHGMDISNRLIDELNHSKPSDASGDIVSEAAQLRERLVSCQQELEELKEKYRELDEECETCAQYLRERDQQCARLKKEKATLQTTVSELKEKLQSCNPNQSQQIASKTTFAHVGVNTDEDWTNLHSVVVDRMSFDAEVEKNKKLTKTIEELRFKKQDLKNTIAKMQKALEKNGNRELESTRHELQACKQELMQLRQKYKELDDECETCAQYLREKEEQCRRLKEAKNTLEAKLQEFQGDFNAMAHSTRKKRQSLHDQNRTSTVEFKDASTETCDDLLSYQVERDGSGRHLSENVQTKEIKRLKSVLEKLSQQKAVLEQQLVTVSGLQHVAHPAMYVATGSAIVQNQQLTDVIKENQKLKKINAKLVNICKKRGKDSNRENEDPADQG
ncbi:kinesin-related protein 4 [Spodoptera frugiperda]|uniref:Kinesin-related protein 4 n=2 Tax=Spodoptera frugiperda TaxID=7108 RepID=A0A9R0F4D2_SPOFR|nr:kinesin-related protein 4 [Spodoptera frugiperda]